MKDLIGEWSASGQGPSGPNGEPGMSWSKTYVFTRDGKFEMNGYPPLIVNGEWKTSQDAAGVETITFSKQKMRMSKSDKPSDWGDQTLPLKREDTAVVIGADRYTKSK